MGGGIYGVGEILQNVFMIPYTKEIGYKSLIIVQAWSLVFEMYFYFMMALTILIFKKRQYIIPVLVSLGVVALGVKFVNPLNIMEVGLIKYIVSIVSAHHIPKFIAGIAVAAIYSKHQMKLGAIDINKPLYKLLFLVIQAAFFITLLIKYSHFIAPVMALLFFISALFYDHIFKVNYQTIYSKVLTYLGDISYSIYMIHFLVIYILLYQLQITNFTMLLALTFAITIVLSAIAYKYVEKHFINIGRRLIKKVYKYPLTN